MVERICPSCRFGNTVDAHYCNKCGSPLEQLVPIRPGETTALTIAGRSLPVNWKQVGTTVALGAAAIAAEIGIAWLRRKAEGSSSPAPLMRVEPQTHSIISNNNQQAKAITTIISERVIEIFESSDGRKLINDRHFWRKIDE